MENAGISLNRYARKQLRRSESLGQQIFEIGMEKEALNGLERLIKVLMKTNERKRLSVRKRMD